MNKKLRLLVTTKCPNKCPMCCNNQFDFSKLPVVDRWDYDEIMITGGEPLLHISNVMVFLRNITVMCSIMGIPSPKIYIYTSLFDQSRIIEVLSLVDGIVLTPHKKEDIRLFTCINSNLLQCYHKFENRSLRLNLFPDMKELLPKDIDLSLWKVKDIEWVENCPVPEGEDFRRIANLW